MTIQQTLRFASVWLEQIKIRQGSMTAVKAAKASATPSLVADQQEVPLTMSAKNPNVQ